MDASPRSVSYDVYRCSLVSTVRPTTDVASLGSTRWSESRGSRVPSDILRADARRAVTSLPARVIVPDTRRHRICSVGHDEADDGAASG